MILVYGGGASGKSEYAEQLVSAEGYGRKYYLAAMERMGAEAEQRIERHRKKRAGKGFLTLECPRDIASAAEIVRDAEQAAALLECISNLTANELFSTDGTMGDTEETADKIVEDVLTLDERFGRLVVVSNNVFEDGIQYDEWTNQYIRCMAEINQRLAAAAEEVIEVVLGIPVRIGCTAEISTTIK